VRGGKNHYVDVGLLAVDWFQFLLTT
jgi:hypothetical protein